MIFRKTNQRSCFPPLHGTYTSTLSSMVLASRLTPTGARFDSSAYSFFNLFWNAIILMTSRITWSSCATVLCMCAILILALRASACVKPADVRSSRDMGVDVETLTPGDGMRTVDCCNKSCLAWVGVNWTHLVAQTCLHSPSWLCFLHCEKLGSCMLGKWPWNGTIFAALSKLRYPTAELASDWLATLSGKQQYQMLPNGYECFPPNQKAMNNGAGSSLV